MGSLACDFCPRYCRVDRTSGQRGFCAAGSLPTVASYGPHHWEEPPISGRHGSGTVFFTHCNMRCVFCQNHDISQVDPGAGRLGTEVMPEGLADIFMFLQNKGTHNVNLVSPTHYAAPIAQAIRIARGLGLQVPVVYNSNGYDSPETLDRMDGLVDVYLPDLKYMSGELSARYSGTPSYFKHASQAICEMARQVGAPKFDSHGIIKSGLIVRHLVLPGCADDSILLLRWIKDNLPEGTFLSVMSQYHPAHKAQDFPEIDRRLTREEYGRVRRELHRLGLKEGFCQGLSSSDPSFTPKFRGEDLPDSYS